MRETPPRRSFAVTAIGVLTLLVAALYALAAGGLLFIGFAAGTEAAAPTRQPSGWEGLGMMVAAFAALLGVAFGLLVALGIPAGVGVLLCRPWGRILAFIFAPLALVVGIAFALSTPDELYVLIGLAQILYGFFAILVLSLGGSEFRRRVVRGREDSR